MIELKVEYYCQNCKRFSPVLHVDDKSCRAALYGDGGRIEFIPMNAPFAEPRTLLEYRVDTTITCSHADECAYLCQMIKGSTEDAR